MSENIKNIIANDCDVTLRITCLRFERKENVIKIQSISPLKISNRIKNLDKYMYKHD